MSDHQTAMQAVLQINKFIEQAAKGRFMVAVFRVEGELCVDVTTWEFPVDRMADAVELLSRQLDQHTARPRPHHGPLPPADILAFMNKVRGEPDDSVADAVGVPTPGPGTAQQPAAEVGEGCQQSEQNVESSPSGAAGSAEEG